MAVYKGPVLIDSKLLLSDHYGIVRILDAELESELENLSIGKISSRAYPSK